MLFSLRKNRRTSYLRRLGFSRRSRGYPGPKLRSGPSKLWKNKHLGVDIHDPQVRTSTTSRDLQKNFGQKNFGLNFRSQCLDCSGKEKAHKHTSLSGDCLGEGGVSRLGGQGQMFMCRARNPRKIKTFSSGYPSGRIGDRDDRKFVYVPNVCVPFLAPDCAELCQTALQRSSRSRTYCVTNFRQQCFR